MIYFLNQKGGIIYRNRICLLYYARKCKYIIHQNYEWKENQNYVTRIFYIAS